MGALNYPRLIVSIITCQLAGILGSVFTTSSVSTWYPTLVKPFFTPPSWVFAPVWTALYLLMGISLYLLWDSAADGRNRRDALFFFWGQLILNVLWSAAFFGLQSPVIGLVVIIVLWLFIVALIMTSYRVSRLAAYLLIPYILWVTYAGILNVAIVGLN